MQNIKNEVSFVPLIDFKKYIGIPFGYNEPDTANCVSLAARVFKDAGIAVPATDGRPFHDTWFIEAPHRLLFFLERNFMRIAYNQLQELDIIYFKINGEGHIGLYIGDDKFLTTMPKQNSFSGGVSYIDRLQYCKPHIMACYRCTNCSSQETAHSRR